MRPKQVLIERMQPPPALPQPSAHEHGSFREDHVFCRIKLFHISAASFPQRAVPSIGGV